MQDAHEFLNYLLNECSELLEREAKAKLRRARQPPVGSCPAAAAAATGTQQQHQQRVLSGQQASTPEPGAGKAGQQAEQQKEPPEAAPPTFIHELFQVRSSSRATGWPISSGRTVLPVGPARVQPGLSLRSALVLKKTLCAPCTLQCCAEHNHAMCLMRRWCEGTLV